MLTTSRSFKKIDIFCTYQLSYLFNVYVRNDPQDVIFEELNGAYRAFGEPSMACCAVGGLDTAHRAVQSRPL
jgi:hypothetical protein